MLDLKVIAARYVLERLPIDAMPDIATEALVCGLDSPATRSLAGLVGANMSEVRLLFARMLEQLQIQLPHREQALRQLLGHVIEKVALRRCGPREGLKEVVQLSYLAETAEGSGTYVGEALGIEHLVGAYWAYDDLAGRPTEVSYEGLYGQQAALALDEEVVRLAHEWLNRHGA